MISLGSASDNATLTQHWPWISHLARLSDLTLSDANTHNEKGVPFVMAGSTFVLAINDVIAVDDVQKVLQGKHDTLTAEVAHLAKKLTNEAFKAAKPDVWQADFDVHGQKMVEAEKIKAILAGLV
jgi:valyl-tRNA synthetase